MKPSDKIRLYIASLNGAEFTVAKIISAIEGLGKSTVSVLLNNMAVRKEIERTDTITARGNPAIYREIKLKPVNLLRRSESSADIKLRLDKQAEHRRTQCALRLQTALDRITRHNREASHA